MTEYTRIFEKPTKDQIKIALVMQALGGVAYNGQICMMDNYQARYTSFETTHNVLHDMTNINVIHLVQRILSLYDREMPLSKPLKHADIEYLTEVIFEHFEEIKHFAFRCCWGPVDKPEWLKTNNGIMI